MFNQRNLKVVQSHTDKTTLIPAHPLKSTFAALINLRNSVMHLPRHITTRGPPLPSPVRPDRDTLTWQTLCNSGDICESQQKGNEGWLRTLNGGRFCFCSCQSSVLSMAKCLCCFPILLRADVFVHAHVHQGIYNSLDLLVYFWGKVVRVRIPSVCFWVPRAWLHSLLSKSTSC